VPLEFGCATGRTPAELERFASAVIEHGLTEASGREGIGVPRGRELMRIAASEGLVAKIGDARGRSAYVRTDLDVRETPAALRAHWHRSRWFEMQLRAAILQANWERQSGAADDLG
jgi:hypothetical protein